MFTWTFCAIAASSKTNCSPLAHQKVNETILIRIGSPSYRCSGPLEFAWRFRLEQRQVSQFRAASRFVIMDASGSRPGASRLVDIEARRTLRRPSLSSPWPPPARPTTRPATGCPTPTHSARHCSPSPTEWVTGSAESPPTGTLRARRPPPARPRQPPMDRRTASSSSAVPWRPSPGRPSSAPHRNASQTTPIRHSSCPQAPPGARHQPPQARSATISSACVTTHPNRGSISATSSLPRSVRL